MSESLKQTRYGFRWGPARVYRVISHDGHVVLSVVGARKAVEIRVTPSGLLRISPVRKPYKHELEDQEPEDYR